MAFGVSTAQAEEELRRVAKVWRLSALPGVFGDERRQALHNHAAHRRVATIRLNHLAPPAYRHPTVCTSGMLSCCAAVREQAPLHS